MKTIIAIMMLLAFTATNTFSQQRDYQVKDASPKKIKVPATNLKPGEVKYTDDLKKVIDNEVAYQVQELKKSYDDFPEKPELKETKVVYKTDDGIILIHQTVYVDYEYTEISVFVIIDKDKTLAYSRADVLSEFIGIVALKKKGSGYQLFGTLKGNPKSKFSGDFCWMFEGKNRTLEFSTKK